MIKLVVGVKGTGKTKTLIDSANAALAQTKGNVVCLEKGTKLRYDINYQIRLINTDEYYICNASGLGGFIAGILASDSDVTDVFIDSALKIVGNDVASFDQMLLDLEKVIAGSDINMMMTLSIPSEDVSDVMKRFI